jgi:hypothetical protein
MTNVTLNDNAYFKAELKGYTMVKCLEILDIGVGLNKTFQTAWNDTRAALNPLSPL